MQIADAMLERLVVTLVTATIPVIIFRVSLGVSLREFLQAFQHPLSLLRLLLIVGVIVPLLTAALCKFMLLPRVVIAILLVTAMAPGDPFTVLEAEEKKGHIALAAVTTVLLTFLLPLLIAIWAVPFSQWFHLDLRLAPREAFSAVAPVVLPPILGGILLREYAAKLAERLQRIAGILSVVLIIVTTLVIILTVPRGLAYYTIRSVIAIVIIITLGLALGFFGVGYGDRKARITSALTASLGNFVIVLLIARIIYHLPMIEFAGIGFVFLLLRVLTIFCWYLATKRWLFQPDVN